jgi:hypothetical protein
MLEWMRNKVGALVMIKEVDRTWYSATLLALDDTGIVVAHTGTEEFLPYRVIESIRKIEPDDVTTRR